jgi:hypothetical protein
MTIATYKKETDTLVQLETANSCRQRQGRALLAEVERLGWQLVALSLDSKYQDAGWCISRRGFGIKPGHDYVTHSWSVNAQGQACLVSGHYDLSVVGAYTSLQERTL